MQKGDGRNEKLMKKNNIIIGILALQGDFVEHKAVIEKLGVFTKEIRKAYDLKEISGLIIPGGESTTMSLLLKNNSLRSSIKKLAKKGIPIYGTCAGAILLAHLVNGKKNTKGIPLVDIDIKRNAYGSQLESFEENILISIEEKEKKFNAIFIRAPKITKIGDDVKILSRNRNKDIVMIQKNNILISTFHPELTNDNKIHRYFVDMCRKFMYR